MKKRSKRRPKTEQRRSADPPIDTFGGEPRDFVTKKECATFLGKAPKLVARMLHASRHGDPWLDIGINKQGKGGVATRVTLDSLRRAAKRLAAGEEPPLLPSELRRRLTLASPGGAPNRTGATLLEACGLLPKGVAEAIFRPGRNQIEIRWTDGDTSIWRIVRRSGRPTRLIEVRFKPTGKLDTASIAGKRSH